MKTNKEWLETLPEPVRGWALSNMYDEDNKNIADKRSGSLGDAIFAIHWVNNPRCENINGNKLSIWAYFHDSIIINNDTLTIPEMNRILKEFGLEKHCVNKKSWIEEQIDIARAKSQSDLENLVYPKKLDEKEGLPIERVGSEEFENRQITMSLETAKELYKDLCTRTDIASVNFKNWLLENFTKEELEPVVVPEPKKEGFTWEDSFGPGFVIGENRAKLKVEIVKCSNKVAQDHFMNQFRTEKQALSALAFAQLSHICAKYNEGKKPEAKQYTVVCWKEEGLAVFQKSEMVCHLPFCTKEDAETSLRVNRELWEQYWMED